MNEELIRLTAAVVAGSDEQTAEQISRLFDAEQQELLRDAVQSFKSSIDVREWRRAMSAGVVQRLYHECCSDATTLDMLGQKAAKPSRFDGMGLGEKSVRSLERILERMAVPEGAG